MLWTGHRRSVHILLASITALLVAILGAAPADAAWRPFAQNSPWNVPAALKGPITGSNPFGSQFTSYASAREISGVAPDNEGAKPIFFAKPGDPEYKWTD